MYGAPALGLAEPLIAKALHNFSQALADDLNISVALSAVFELMHEINSLRDRQQLGEEEARQTIDCLKKMNSVLGFLNFEKHVEDIPQDLQDALERRIQARKDRNWALADELRDLIANRGYVIEDTSSGPRLKKQS